MLNILPASSAIASYNTLYQQLSDRSFEEMTQTAVHQELLVLQKKLALIAHSLLPQYFDEFTQSIRQLNELAITYNHTYDKPVTLLQLPPEPQLFGPILAPPTAITQISDLGLSQNWDNTALKVGWIVLGVALNVLGFTAGRYSMRAANALLQTTAWDFAEIMTSEVIENALKATALGSVNGAAFFAPLVENRSLAIDAVSQELFQRRPSLTLENEGTTSELEWETVESSIQVSLSSAAQKFENNGDPISACLFDDLYVLTRFRSLLGTETYDDCDVLAIIQTLEYLAHYFIGVYPNSRDILHDIIQKMSVVHFNSQYASRLQQVLFLSRPASFAQKSCEYILTWTALPGYSLIDWSRLQKLRFALPKELLERLVEVRQFNQYAITQLRAIRYNQYRNYLKEICAEKDEKIATPDLKVKVKELTISVLLQKFSSWLQYPIGMTNDGEVVSKKAGMGSSP